MSNPSSDGYNATLFKRIDISPRLATFQVVPDEGVFDFTAGQFAILGLKWKSPRHGITESEEISPEKGERILRRAYSISSASDQKHHLEFYIALVSDGQMTTRLYNLQAGDRLFVGKKASGLFTLDRTPPDKNILLIATGTGLAPYISMVRTLALGEGCPVRPITVIHGASFSWDLGYRNELEELKNRCDRFTYLPTISQPDKDTGWQGHTGRINDWIESVDLSQMCNFAVTPADTHIFLCGNPAMVERGITQFEAMGYDQGTRKEPGSLHVEKYW